jgi:hypothetical protein
VNADVVHKERMKESYQKIIVISVVALAAGAIVFGVLVLERLERITQVAERTEAKLDRILAAAAPVGRAAVKKGAEALNEMDAEGLADSAADGLKEIGSAAKQKLIEHLEKKRIEDAQQQN